MESWVFGRGARIQGIRLPVSGTPITRSVTARDLPASTPALQLGDSRPVHVPGRRSAKSRTVRVTVTGWIKQPSKSMHKAGSFFLRPLHSRKMALG